MPDFILVEETSQIILSEQIQGPAGAGSGDWTTIVGKPSTFPPDAHTHNYEAAGAVTAHEGAADPHPGYLTEAEADLLYKDIAAPAGGGWTSVIDWAHTTDLASIVVPFEDGAYEMFANVRHGQAAQQMQLLFSTDGGTTTATLTNVNAQSIAINPFGGPTVNGSSTGQADGMKLMGGLNLPGFIRISMLVTNGGKHISVQESSQYRSGTNWSWLAHGHIEHASALNACKLVMVNGNFLTESFFKVWKVS